MQTTGEGVLHSEMIVFALLMPAGSRHIAYLL